MGQSTSQVDVASLEAFYDQQMKKQVAVADLQFERKRAYDIAFSREQFPWEFLAGCSTVAILFGASAFTRRKDFIIPAAPVMMFLSYRYDSAFGDYSQDIKDEAEKLLREQSYQVRRVGGPVTLAEIDNIRRSWHSDNKNLV